MLPLKKRIPIVIVLLLLALISAAGLWTGLQTGEAPFFDRANLATHPWRFWKAIIVYGLATGLVGLLGFVAFFALFDRYPLKAFKPRPSDKR